MAHSVRIDNTNETFSCSEEENVLKAMEQLQRRGIPVGCRNGGCGVCKVQVTSGTFWNQKMSRAVCTAQEEAEGIALACRIHPQSDLTVKVLGKMVKAVEAGRSASFAFGPAATRSIKND